MNSAFAGLCMDKKGSCFRLNNETDQPVKIICNAIKEVEATANSQGTTLFDRSFGDGLGDPSPTAFNCEIYFLNTGTQQKINFYNPFWGPVIEFNIESDKKMTVIVLAKGQLEPTRGRASYEFNW